MCIQNIFFTLFLTHLRLNVSNTTQEKLNPRLGKNKLAKFLLSRNEILCHKYSEKLNIVPSLT